MVPAKRKELLIGFVVGLYRFFAKIGVPNILKSEFMTKKGHEKSELMTKKGHEKFWRIKQSFFEEKLRFGVKVRFFREKVGNYRQFERNLTLGFLVFLLAHLGFLFFRVATVVGMLQKIMKRSY